MSDYTRKLPVKLIMDIAGYVELHPKSFEDAEMICGTLGAAAFFAAANLHRVCKEQGIAIPETEVLASRKRAIRNFDSMFRFFLNDIDPNLIYRHPDPPKAEVIPIKKDD